MLQSTLPEAPSLIYSPADHLGERMGPVEATAQEATRLPNDVYSLTYHPRGHPVSKGAPNFMFSLISGFNDSKNNDSQTVFL